MSYGAGLIDRITSVSVNSFLFGNGLPLLTMPVLYTVLGLMVGSMIDVSSSGMKMAVEKSFAYQAFYQETEAGMAAYRANRIKNISTVDKEAIK